MIAYKFLRPDGTSPFSEFRWRLPGAERGHWVEAPVEPCRSGIHACAAGDLSLWVGHSLYEIELDGAVVEAGSKLVASRGRLLRHITAWDDEARAAYTRMCADRAHQLARDAVPMLERWDELVEPAVPEGPALAGFIAARIAEEASGPAAYGAERATQASWLVARVDLEP